MRAAPERMVALLRGVNVGGNRRVPMSDLRRVAEAVGFSDVATYIQSGNLVFSSLKSASVSEAELEAQLARHLGFPVEAIVRTANDWARYQRDNPFAKAARERPQQLHLALSKEKPVPAAKELLKAKAAAGERVEAGKNVLWIDYVGGVGRSKLTPSVLDRCVGSRVTIRNWKTVLTLAQMLGISSVAPADTE